MTTPDILYKLRRELDGSIATEPQVVYLLAGVRKLMERDGAKGKYPALNFHCDWALHSKLEGPGAKRILRQFDTAHPLLKNMPMRLLPSALRAEMDRIIKMTSFHEQLASFLGDYGLPPLTRGDRDGWPLFLYLYAKVIEDIPLVVVQDKKRGVCPSLRRVKARKIIPRAKHVSKVVVRFDEAQQDIGGEALFKVTWTVHDKNGHTGSIEIYNSYSR